MQNGTIGVVTGSVQGVYMVGSGFPHGIYRVGSGFHFFAHHSRRMSTVFVQWAKEN